MSGTIIERPIALLIFVRFPLPTGPPAPAVTASAATFAKLALARFVAFVDLTDFHPDLGPEPTKRRDLRPFLLLCPSDAIDESADAAYLNTMSFG